MPSRRLRGEHAGVQLPQASQLQHRDTGEHLAKRHEGKRGRPRLTTGDRVLLAGGAPALWAATGHGLGTEMRFMIRGLVAVHSWAWLSRVVSARS
jgi:hypothetical protein